MFGLVSAWMVGVILQDCHRSAPVQYRVMGPRAGLGLRAKMTHIFIRVRLAPTVPKRFFRPASCYRTSFRAWKMWCADHFNVLVVYNMGYMGCALLARGETPAF